jgi:hypothetical protein
MIRTRFVRYSLCRVEKPQRCTGLSKQPQVGMEERKGRKKIVIDLLIYLKNKTLELISTLYLKCFHTDIPIALQGSYEVNLDFVPEKLIRSPVHQGCCDLDSSWFIGFASEQQAGQAAFRHS